MSHVSVLGFVLSYSAIFCHRGGFGGPFARTSCALIPHLCRMYPKYTTSVRLIDSPLLFKTAVDNVADRKVKSLIYHFRRFFFGLTYILRRR